MNSVQENSFHDLVPSPTSEQSYNDSSLEGVAANFKLLLKLIQDQKDACNKENTDGLRMLRVATMMTILDNVRTRIKKCQSFGDKRSSESKLRRCYTDVKLTNNVRKEKKQDEAMIDEKEGLKRQLNASLVARKRFEVMCWSLGKEKEIMAAELSKKVHEVNEMEDLINELKDKNECLVEKLQEGSKEKQEIKVETNKALSEQLLRSLDGYRSMKRKWKNAHEENMKMHASLEEMGHKIESGIHHFRQQISSVEEIIELEHVIESLEMQVAKHL
ncbi:uncharacterized protein LOC125840899 [Solanum verrucosum]|uniref:uncharacterized protein LOC125840899 n=1 Tax=Solanum verrucosum TaxID=315347 RepID=UPI0020D19751|nr:uncharacterized protein LOC125840899 [Solanum verrucosum]